MKGFTLLELLVSVSIVGILTAITVPAYSAYKARAYDSVALSDLRAAAIAQESYHIEQESYLTCSNDSCLVLPGIKAISRGVTLTMEGTDTSFTATSKHSKGTGLTYIWRSEEGGLVAP